MKEKLLNLIDRRTTVCLVALVMIFVIALLGTERITLEAMNSIVWVTIGLAGSNSIQKSIAHFKGVTEKPEAKKPKT